MSEERTIVIASDSGIAIRSFGDISDALGACLGSVGLILTEDDLSREFFDLRSGLAGELFQKFTNYRLRVVIVLPDPQAYGERFGELAYEHMSHNLIRIVRSKDEAIAWLSKANGLGLIPTRDSLFAYSQAGDSMTQTSGLIIRRAVFRDAELLSELGARTFSETFGAENTPEDMAAYIATSFSLVRMEAELNDSRSTFLIAEIDGVAVGYARLLAGDVSESVEGDRPIELVRLYVSAEWHGRGVGEGLMRSCIAEARGQGYRTLWLGVWERNSRARAFYRKWAFHEIGKHIFQLGADRQTDVLMERSV